MKETKVILFQGDSITDAGRNREQQGVVNGPYGGTGYGYPLFASARLLADQPQAGLQFYNLGISGNRVVDLYARWKIDALNIKPDILSILIGVNDTWHEKARQNGVEVPRYEMIFRMLLEWTKKELPETKLVLMEPFVFLSEAVDVITLIQALFYLLFSRMFCLLIFQLILILIHFNTSPSL